MDFTHSNKYKEQVHDLIPGGAHTYTKGDDQFPQKAPAAIKYGKGVMVTDLDGNEFLDCSMGLTSVSLGHAFEPILQAVREELEKGVNFQRPSYIELEMAKEFLSLVSCHDMVKFAKNGSTVTTAAVKLARAYTGRNLIAFPSDHPFYSYDDWFIGSTACDKGVPEEIKNLSVTFKSCDIDSLKELFKRYPGQIAAVITEPEKLSCGPSCKCKGDTGRYLEEAIKLSKNEGAIFILDEMVTGFKTDLPGSVSKYNLDPDMATWGKGIANGFSFCALTGKKKIMQLGGINREGEEKVFLMSTTHGAETHSLRAGIKTIEIFKKEKVIEHMRGIASSILDRSNKIINKHNLDKCVEVQGSNWMLGFIFKNSQYEIDPAFKTLFLQEMIANGVLFQGVFVPCYSHTMESVAQFEEAFEKACIVYKKAVDDGVKQYLTGPAVKPVFRKYL